MQIVIYDEAGFELDVGLGATKMLDSMALANSQFVSNGLDRGKLFGDGFFTTGIIENNEVRHLDLHIDRLIDAAAKLKFQSFTALTLSEQLRKLATQLERSFFRVSCSRVQHKRGYAIALDAKIHVSVYLSPWQIQPNTSCAVKFSKIPISMNAYLAGIKHLNRLDNVLAASECGREFQEVLMLNDKKVICGSRSNLFVNIDGSWVTPKLDEAGINGITRQRIIAQTKTIGMRVEEHEISKSELASCKAAFICNSLNGIWPIHRIDSYEIATDLVQELKSKLDFKR